MYNSKPKQRTHRCSKKKHGQPKRGHGCCVDPWSWRDSVKERIRGKRLCRNWQKALNVEDVEV